MSFATRSAQVRAEAQRRQARAARIFWIGGAAVLAAVIAAAAVGWHVYTSSTRDVTVTVNDKNRVCSGSGRSVTCQYLIFTSGGTFKDTDSLLAGKFASSDLYGQLQVGHAYKLRVRGYRVPILSEYPNILDIEAQVR